MIIKGASRRNVKFWAKHLTDTKKNDRAEMVDKRGLLSENLTDMLHEIQDNAHLTKCQNAMYIASFSPAIGEKLTEVDWERAFEIFEKHRGIPEGQRRIVYEHEKEGREHRHVIWDRIDAEQMKAFHDAYDWKVCAVASQEITQELGLQHTPGILFREEGAPRPERNPQSWEMFRGMKTEIDVKELAADVKALRQQSENGQQFKAALEQHGFQLTTGNRGLLILDSAGNEHSLARRCGVTLKEINAFMQDVDREALPRLEQAKEQHRAQINAHQHTELSSVRYEIQWEEALDRAAIAKEEKERRFVEPAPGQAQPEPKPEPKKEETRAGQQQEQEPARGTLPPGQQQPQPANDYRKPAAPQLGKTAGEILLAYSPTNTGQGFANALEDRGLTFAHMTEADAERLNRWERQRLRELAAAAPAPRPDAVQQTQTREGERNTGGDVKPLTRQDTWMAQTGGVDALTPELLDKAEDYYAKWEGDKERYDLADYVSYVQKKEQERRDSGQQQEPAAPKDRYKAGELVVVDQYANVHQLTARNTGDDAKARAEHLKDIDRAALPSVTAAQGAMRQFQQHRSSERQHQWEEKQEQWQREKEASAPAPNDELKGMAARVFSEWQRNNEDMSFTAMLDKIGVRFAIATKDEAERSHKQAALARAAGRYAPSFGEGELVAVTRPSLLYWTKDGEIIQLERVHKLQPDAENYLPDIDRSKLKTIEATKADLEKQAREITEDIASIRSERATVTGPSLGRQAVKATRRWILAVSDRANEAAATVAQKPLRIIGSVVTTAAKLFDALFSFFDPGPPKTREQIEIAKDERDRSSFAAEQTREQAQRHETQVSDHERIADASRAIQQLEEQRRKDFQRYRSDERDRDR